MALQPYGGLDRMDPATWANIKDIFFGAVALTGDERDRRLAEICGDDKTLRAEVEALLKANDEVEDFIEKPAFNVANVLPTDDKAAAGKLIGPYRVVREIGRGGMGTVLLAMRDDGQFRQEVAI